MNHPSLLCLTPTRNEAWIIKTFIAAARYWATNIVVVDQCSSDGTRDELRRCPHVHLITNDSPVYDESHRQKSLLAAARHIPGRRILIGLDADEALSANCLTSPEWDKILRAEPGTIIRFRWANILPGFKTAWIQPAFIPFGFVDDGSEHKGETIHSPRVPQPDNAPTLDMNDIVVLHFQYVLWDRMRSKQRWYQIWEYIRNRKKQPLEIFREYNHMYGSWKKHEISTVRAEWFAAYEHNGIDFRSLKCEPVTWWDREVVQFIADHRLSLSKLAIWDKDWDQVARKIGLLGMDLRDPRSAWEKTVHQLLYFTQSHRENWLVRGLERMLRKTGW